MFRLIKKLFHFPIIFKKKVEAVTVKSVAIKNLFAVISLNIKIQNLKNNLLCIGPSRHMNVRTLPEFLMSLDTSSGRRWKTILPLILLMKSPCLRLAWLAGLPSLTLATLTHSPASCLLAATPASRAPQCSRSRPPEQEKPQAVSSLLRSRVR